MTVSEFINKIGFKVNESDVKKVNGTINNIKSTATKVLGAIGIGFSLGAINSLIEEFGKVNDSIDYAVDSLEAQQAAQQSVLDSANNCRRSYSEMAADVTKLSAANSKLFPISEAATFTEYVSKIGKAAGYNDSVISQMNTTLQGVVAAGSANLNTVTQLESTAPALVDKICDGLGTSRKQLEQMAASGTLTASKIKTAMLNATDSIDDAFGNTKMRISDALQIIRNKWGLWLAQTDETLNITNTISRTMVSGFNKVISVLNKVRNGFVWLSEKVGGTENLLKLISVIASSLFVAFNFNKIKSGLSSIMTILGGINLKMLAIIAVIVIIALLVDDFINFMQGNDSLIGSLLEKAGIDSEKVRERIIAAWTVIKGFLLEAWNVIKQVCSTVWGAINNFFGAHGDQIKKALGDTWTIIKQLLIGIWNVISAIATAVWSALQSYWDTWGDSIITLFSGIWETIKAIFSTVFNIICDLLAIFADLFSGNWSQLWEDLKKLLFDVLTGIVNIISNLLTTIWNTIKSVWDVIWNYIANLAQNIWNMIININANILRAIVSTVLNIRNSIIEGFTAAIDWIKQLPAQAVQWGRDIIMGIVDGIKGAVGAVGDAVKGIASTIKGFIGFSEPEEGPLSNFHTYMPDMIDLMSKGITDGKSKIKDSLGELTEDMSIMARANYVSGGTASAATGGNNVSKSIVQSVEINNEFNGDSAIQKEASKAMDNSTNDITAQLARGLAFAK